MWRGWPKWVWAGCPKTMTKTDAPTPQRISVPEGTVLQIYSRDAYGNKMLLSLPGPVDISMVSMDRREIE